MPHQELERIKEVLASVREQHRILTDLQAKLSREIDYATALLKALTPAVAVSATLNISKL